MNRVHAIHSVLFEYPIVGWVAFGGSVVCFLLFIAWEYKKEADIAKKALLAISGGSKVNSETAPLIQHQKNAPWKNPGSTQFHKIDTDDEQTDDDPSVKSARAYVYPQYRAPSTYAFVFSVPFMLFPSEPIPILVRYLSILRTVNSEVHGLEMR